MLPLIAKVDEEIYIPYNFDAKEILKIEGWKEFMVERHYQKLEFILHQIYINRVTNTKYHKGDFIKLSSKYHFERYLYGRDFHRLMPLLKKYKVLEDNGSFTVASPENNYQGECKGYRLTTDYDQRHIRVTVDKDTTLYKNIVRFRQQDLAAQSNVTRWINFHVQDISIREKDATHYVEQ